LARILWDFAYLCWANTKVVARKAISRAGDSEKRAREDQNWFNAANQPGRTAGLEYADQAHGTRDKFDAKGLLEGFEIDGISDELCEKYSQRRGEIEERIADFKAEHGSY
jgi:hypothetical protein